MGLATEKGLDFAVDPFKEAVAYETLLALKGSSESKLEEEFPSPKSHSPQTVRSLTAILEIKKQDGDRQSLDELYPLVERFLVRQTPFSVCTQKNFQYLKGLWDAQTPLKLFYYAGDLTLLDSPCVSVVGARNASPRGLELAIGIAEALAQNGYTIVSGLAKGIDTAALSTVVKHRDGRAIGVIGTPINHYYPKENIGLQNVIASNHLLISHTPFYRYSHEPFPHRRFYFPKRNVTMAAISQATVIVETSETSGTRSQAEAVIRQRQGRRLFIMANCFNNCRWPDKFIARGAIRIENIEHLLDELQKMPAKNDI